MRITEFITEGKQGLWANIHAKQDRIKHGSGEKMRKPGSKGAPSAQDFKDAANEAANPAQQAAIAIAKKKEQGVAEGFGKDIKRLATGKDVKSRAGQEIAKSQDASMKGDHKTSKKHFDRFDKLDKLANKEQGVAEGVRNLGYDAQSLIMKLRRDVEEKRLQPTRQAVLAAARELAGDMDFAPQLLVKQVLGQGVAEGENWSKHNHKRVGGMSDKSVKSYRRSHPGSKIQTAVTTKPSKIKKGSKDSKRRASFCARMRGMKKHNTSAKTAHDPDSNINKSLRRWHCESVEQLEQLVMLAEQKIRNLKK